MVISLKFSRTLFLAFILIYALCGFLIVLSPIMQALQVLLVLYLLGHAVVVLRRYVLRSTSKSIQKLIYNEETDWQLEDDKGHWVFGSLVQVVKISCYFLLLGFEIKESCFPVYVLLTADGAVEDSQWRRLQYVLSTVRKRRT